MILLFRSGPLTQKLPLVLKATRQHARNLAYFALVYKSTMLLLSRINAGKVYTQDPFLAGLLGGYVVFGRRINSPVAQQIVIYVFARVCLAAAKLAVQPHIAIGENGVYMPARNGWGLLDRWPDTREAVRDYGWVAFASLSWACVMWLFKWHPDVVQPSLRSSMNYMCVGTLPFPSPFFIFLVFACTRQMRRSSWSDTWGTFADKKFTVTSNQIIGTV